LCIEDLELNRIVGEICAIPLDDNTFNSTIKSDFDDRKLLPENIASYDLPDFYKLYLCSISVDPSYQNVTLAYKMLFDAYIDFLLELAKEDIFFIEASSMAVTNEGVKLCKSLNMKLKTEGLHNSKIFHVYLMPPAFKIASRKSVLLNRCYKNKYEEYKAIFDMNVS